MNLGKQEELMLKFSSPVLRGSYRMGTAQHIWGMVVSSRPLFSGWLSNKKITQKELNKKVFSSPVLRGSYRIAIAPLKCFEDDLFSSPILRGSYRIVTQ